MASLVKVVCSSSAVLLFLIGAGLIAAGVSIIKVVLPRTQRSLLLQNRTLERLPDGSLNSMAQSWANPEYVSCKQYWIYNYTNPLDVQNRGSPPDMFEKGPYSYRVVQSNTISGFSEDGAELMFRPKNVYTFNKETSCSDCDPEDVFLVPDLVFFKTMNHFTTVEGVKEIVCSLPGVGDLVCGATDPDALNEMLQGLIDSYTDYAAISIKALDAGPFVYTTVDELLFKGYDDPLFSKVVHFILSAVGMISPALTDFPKNISSPNIHLNNKNATLGAEYTILTGKYDSERIAQVLSFFVGENSTDNADGSWLPPAWWTGGGTRECPAYLGALARKINGTMGDLFAPLIQKEDVLHIYDEDLCRSVPLQFKEEATLKGVNGYRFVVPTDAFNCSILDNCGFCHLLKYDIFSKNTGERCLPDGLMDISRCVSGNIPIAVSHPHFLGASREVTRLFLRYKPNPDNDQTTFDIEPISGVLLRSNRLSQLNVMVNRIEHARAYQTMLPLTYPIVWTNTSTVIGDMALRDLQNKLTGPNATITIICWVLGVGVGSLLILISITMLTTTSFSSHPKKHDDEKDPRDAKECNHSEVRNMDANSFASIDSNDVFPMLSDDSNARKRIAYKENHDDYAPAAL